MDDICYGGRTNCIAAVNLGMGKSCSPFFVQFKQYLAPLYNTFTGLLVTISAGISVLPNMRLTMVLEKIQ